MATMRLVEGGAVRESDDRLLMREFAHRVGNDFAAAIAAMRLTQAGAGPAARAGLVEGAIGRLECAGAVLGLLAAPVRREEDVGALVDGVCRGVGDWRPAAGGEIRLDLPRLRVDGELARRVALVAAELVSNAVRHALDGRRGVLTVTLRRTRRGLRLSVVDDGPGIRDGAPASGTGWGRGIVAELVDRGGGSMAVDTGAHGTAVTVVLPMAATAIGPEADLAF